MTVPHDCSRCCLNRRQCLQVLSMTALGAGAVLPTLQARAEDSAKPAAGDVIDARSLRPHPEVRMAATFFEMPRPYWLGWPGTTYDLDARQSEYRGKLEASVKQLGIGLAMEAKPISDETALSGWIAKLKEQQPHGVLVMLQHLQTWKWVERVAKEAEIPMIVFAPVGTAFTGHVARGSKLPRVHVVSSMDWSAVENGMRLIRAKRLFEETRVLWIRGKERNETVMERLGIKVRAIPRDTFNQEFDKQIVTAEVKDVASQLRARAKKIVEPDENDTVNCARAYVTAKRLLTAEKANALSMDCLGMVSAKLVPTPPCGAWTLLQDVGVTAGCEADLFAAVSLMMTSYLLDRPGFINDPVPETAHNSLIAAHCTSGTRLQGFDKPPADYILRDHSESSLGVSMQVLWPVGQKVSLVRFTTANDMIIDTGTVLSNIDTPPAGGCRTSVEIRMDGIEDCRDVKGFHQVVVLGDHRRILEDFCQLYGIQHVHSPQYSTFAEGSRT